MKILLISFGLASIIFLLLDAIWLSFSVKTFYRPNLEGIPLNDKPILWAAIIFYLMYTIGLTLIILLPAINANSVFLAFWTGAIFGIVSYGTYNLTNMVFIQNWSVSIVIVDTIWGGLLTSVASSSSVYIIKNYFI